MLNKKNKVQGVITILVSLLLTGILSLGTLALESGRFQAAKTQLGEANTSAGTSMLASYDADMFARYGLLVIDNEAANAGRYRDYLEFNSDLASGYEGNNVSTMYTVDGVEFEMLYNLTYPSVLKRQILSRAKHNLIPQDFALNQYNVDYFITDIISKADHVAGELSPTADGLAGAGSASDIPGDMQSALSALYETFKDTEKFGDDYDVTVDSVSMSLLPSATGTVENTIHSEDMDLINASVADAKTVLGANGDLLQHGGRPYSENDVSVNASFVDSAYSKLSSTGNIVNEATSLATDCKALVSAVRAAFKVLMENKEENIYLNSYISGYFPCRNRSVAGYNGPDIGTTTDGSAQNMNFAGAAVEYVIGGSSVEKANQQTAYDYAFAVRFINNLYSTFTGSDCFNNQNASVVAAHIAWAYFETYADMELLSAYGATVPFNKYEMILPITERSAVANAFASGNLADGMTELGILQDATFVVEGTDATTYKDALALALWLVPNSKKLLRTADLIQLEMRYDEQYGKNETASFLLSDQNTFCRVKCSATLNPILPIISLGTNSGFNGITIRSVKYVGY